MKVEKYSPKWLLNKIKNSKSDAEILFNIIEFQNALIKIQNNKKHKNTNKWDGDY